MMEANDKHGFMDAAGHVTKIKEVQENIDPKMDIQQFHIRNMGKLIEANEGDIRSDLNSIYINKTK